MRKIDLTGKRFGKLVVLKRAESAVSKSGKTRGRWLCKCDCGNTKIILTDSLTGGKAKSCGCYNLECIKNRATKHGMTGKRICVEWSSMKSRCFNKNNKSYMRYGGRGITVCEEWLGDNGFENFYEWAINNGYEDSLTIERKDVNGNYCPENCCWIPANEQAKNRRSTLRIKDKSGIERYAMDIAEENGLPMNIVIARKSNGWDLEKALSTPIIEQTLKKSVIQIDLLTGDQIKTYKSIGEASRIAGVERSSISRCCSGERNMAGGYGWKYA